MKDGVEGDDKKFPQHNTEDAFEPPDYPPLSLNTEDAFGHPHGVARICGTQIIEPTEAGPEAEAEAEEKGSFGLYFRIDQALTMEQATFIFCMVYALARGYLKIECPNLTFSLTDNGTTLVISGFKNEADAIMVCNNAEKLKQERAQNEIAKIIGLQQGCTKELIESLTATIN